MKARPHGKRALVALAVLLLGARSPAALGAAQLTISAAASLTEAFSEVGEAFGKANPGVKLAFNFGASGALLQQLDNGAPVDVFASADRETMDRAEARQLIDRSSRRDFATNRLVLAAPAGASLVARTLGDLRTPEVRRVALGNPAFVPVGRYAREALEASGSWAALQPKLVFGSTVRQVLDYLARAEVDAGFVFATDVAAARGKVVVLQELTARDPVVYPIAVVTASARKAAARRFVAFVCSPEGRAILSKRGFGAPVGEKREEVRL